MRLCGGEDGEEYGRGRWDMGGSGTYRMDVFVAGERGRGKGGKGKGVEGEVDQG